jgi:hypothetical protein
MSFHIKYQHKNDQFAQTWHVQSKMPVIPTDAHVVYLRADGHELVLIDQRIRGIPITSMICTWGPPWAHFIFTNLIY